MVLGMPPTVPYLRRSRFAPLIGQEPVLRTRARAHTARAQSIVRSGLMSVNLLYWLDLRGSSALTETDPDFHNAVENVTRGRD